MDLYLKRYFTQIRHATLKKENQLLFLNRLSRLLNNGYSLIEALEVIKWDKTLHDAADTIITSLKDGNSIDQAFEKANFSTAITSYLYFTRVSGEINTSIEKCLQMYEQRLRYIKKFQQVIRYPIVLFVVFTILFYFIQQSVLPSFLNLFESTTETSSILFFAIHFGEWVGNIAYISLILLVVIGIAWNMNKEKLSIEQQVKIFRSIPIYRSYKRIQVSFLFATHFSSLLKTGIPIKEILRTMAGQKKLSVLTHYSELIIDELNQGKHIASLLLQLKLIDKQLSIIFQKNADAETLEKDLSVYADLLTEEMNRKIMKTITYIQPIFFLILAGFIIFIYITLMWPMFQLIKTI